MSPLALLLLLLTGTSAAAPRPPTLAVDRIRPGQTGYGLTVFSGFKIERFKVEVIDVLRNFLPKQDIILMRGDHRVLRHAGVLGGMSGSPIYINGKLVGALAYGWRFSKDAVFGVTPIGNMLDMLKLKQRGSPKSGRVVARVATRDSARGRRRGRRTVDRLALADLSRRDRWWRGLLPWRRSPPTRSGATLVPLSVPLSVAGVSRRAMPALRQLFAHYPLEPLRGGGTGRAEGPRRFGEGGAIGVQLVKGDVSMTGTGTVTWTDGKRTLAFGHPMFNAGEIYLPVVTARVNHPLASLARSFKLASPAREIGTLLQDRQPAILADSTRRTRTIPMTLTVSSPAKRSVYKVQLALHDLLTASLARSVLSSAVSEAMSDVAKATYTMTTRLTLRRLPQLKLTDERYSLGGLRMGGLNFSRGLRAISLVANNRFQSVDIERIDMNLQIRYGETPIAISGIRLASNLVAPGERIRVFVTFRPYSGREFTRAFPLTIPKSYAGSMLSLKVGGGNSARPDAARPESLQQFLGYISRAYPARSVVLTLITPTEGIKLRGRVLSDLPQSVIDSLRSGSMVRTEAIARTALRKVYPTKNLVNQSKTIRIRVKSDKEDAE